MSQRPELTQAQRQQILDGEIAKYTKRGFQVTARTETTVQLKRPKKFSFLWAFLWFLLLGIGILVYLFYYWSKKDDVVFIQVDERGKVKRTK